MKKIKLLTFCCIILNMSFNQPLLADQPEVKLCNNNQSLLSTPAVDQPGDMGPLISKEGILADFDEWFEYIKAIHPDLSYSTDLEQLEKKKEYIRSQVIGPMSQLEVYNLFSLLNPIFKDAHNGIWINNKFGRIEEQLAKTDRLFPLSVRITKNDGLVITGLTEKIPGLELGSEICTINGAPVEYIVDELVKRTVGDTRAFRQGLMSERFAEMFWITFGTSPTFKIGIKEKDCIKEFELKGATKIPAERKLNRPLENYYSYDVLDGNVGIIRADTFSYSDYKGWLNFTKEAFAEFSKKKITSLIIDIRKNRGGSDDMWIGGLMPYLAHKSWDRLSGIKVLATKDNLEEAEDGQVIGQPYIVDYRGTHAPSADTLHKFHGDLYVMTGSKSYSSAIMFAVAIQDNGLGKIIGTQTEGRSCSTGQIQDRIMPNTKLEPVIPLHIYYRKSGKGCFEGVVPDIPLNEDPMDSDAAIKQMLEIIRK